MGWLGTGATIAAGILGTPAAGLAVDQAFNGGNVTKTITGAVGDAANTIANVGTNGQQYAPADVLYPQYAGGPGGAANESLLGVQGMKDANAAGNALTDQGLGSLQSASYGASEDPTLANNEAYSRGYDQAGSLQLDREAALGQAPSAAAFQMQHGLDQAIANQSAVAGGARGGAGIALAQGNMGANIANLQNQAYTGAGQLRAQEMAQARQAYDQSAQTMRAQDQSRLGMGDQMGQFNVNNARDIGSAALQNGLGYGNLAGNYYQASQNPYAQQLQADTASANNYAQATMGSQGINAGIGQSNANTRKDNTWNTVDTIGGLVKGAGGGLGGSTPKV